MGFCSLQHSKVRRSTVRGRCRRPLRSALRVWLPSRRLTPSEPVPAFFHAGGALGIRPSELSPRGRYPTRFRMEGPTYRLTSRCSRRRSDGPAQQAPVSGLCPFRESLATDAGLVRRPLDAPLGFALLGYAGGNLARDFARTPPTRFAVPASQPTRPAPRSLADSRLAPPDSPASQGTDGTTLLGFSHQHDPERSSEQPPGLFDSPCAAPHIAAGRRRALSGPASLYRSRSGYA